MAYKLFWIKIQTQDMKVVLSFSEEGGGRQCQDWRNASQIDWQKKETNELQLYLKKKTQTFHIWKLSSDRWIEAVTTDTAVVPSETHLLWTGNKIYVTETL